MTAPGLHPLMRLTLVWSQLCLSPLILLGALWFLHPNGDPTQWAPGSRPHGFDVPSVVLTGVAATALAASPLVSGLVTRGWRGRTVTADAVATAFILRWAVIEAVGILGFVVGQLAENPFQALPFVVASVVTCLAARPSEAAVERLIRDAGGTPAP